MYDSLLRIQQASLEWHVDPAASEAGTAGLAKDFVTLSRQQLALDTLLVRSLQAQHSLQAWLHVSGAARYLGQASKVVSISALTYSLYVTLLLLGMRKSVHFRPGVYSHQVGKVQMKP